MKTLEPREVKSLVQDFSAAKFQSQNQNPGVYGWSPLFFPARNLVFLRACDAPA